MRLKDAMVKLNFAVSFAEVRSAIGSQRLRIDGELAQHEDQEVSAGMQIAFGKHRTGTVPME
jgi:hypothetical protein